MFCSPFPQQWESAHYLKIRDFYNREMREYVVVFSRVEVATLYRLSRRILNNGIPLFS
jgi:hypothetical protein